MAKIRNKDRLEALKMLLKSPTLIEMSKSDVIRSFNSILHCCQSANTLRLFQNAGMRINKHRSQDETPTKD